MTGGAIGSSPRRAARVHAFVLLLVTLFFVQDVTSVAALHAGLGALVPFVSGAKEALIAGFLVAWLLSNAGRLTFDGRTQCSACCSR